jgi:CheY-like chemotaxis protein
MDILIVDDNPTDLKLTQMAFKESEFPSTITTAGNGREALDMIYERNREKRSCPDIILMDIRMPVMDGLETLEKLKSDPLYSKIPVAILTTSKNEVDVERSYRSGAVSYIQKPVSFREFKEFVKSFHHYWTVVSVLPNKPEDC